MNIIREVVTERFESDAERKKLNLRNSFTLIELLVVLVIIVILVGITLPVSKYVNERVQRVRSQVMYEKIVSALENYKAEYGEYPINDAGDLATMSRHYTTNYNIDPEGVSIYTNIDLINSDPVSINLPDNSGSVELTTVENLEFGEGTPLKVDYSLIYPLSIKPRVDGKSPFIDVPDARLKYVVWKVTDAIRKQIDGNPQEGIQGHWLRRPVIVDPMTYYQWAYYCSNGLTYYLWITNTFGRVRSL